MKTLVKFLPTLLLLPLIGCDSCKTDPNTTDTTPPTIDWTVKDQTSDTQFQYTGTAAHTATNGHSYIVTACFNDDGGIKKIEDYSIFTFNCQSGEIGQQTGPSQGVLEETPLGLDEDGKAWSRYCKAFTIDPLQFNCSSNFSLVSGYHSFNVTGANYGNLSTTATLTLEVE